MALGLIAAALPAEGESEMSKLMQKMEWYLEKENVRLKEGKPQAKFPVKQAKFLKAKATETKHLSDAHEAYIGTFYKELDAYEKTESDTARRAQYNIVVKSCITCHMEECPGPVYRIRKNYLK